MCAIDRFDRGADRLTDAFTPRVASRAGGGGGGEASTGEGLDRALREMLDDGESPSEASKRAVRELGAKRKEAYAAALRLAGKTGGVDADA
jgi:hypothetical protein